MNKEIKAQWIENLRSGKYEEMTAERIFVGNEGDFTLRWKNYYSPLGVLCDMYAKYFGIKDCWTSRYSKNYPEWKSVEFYGNDWSIPRAVYAWAWIKYDTWEERRMWNMSFAEAIKFIEEL